MVHIGITATRAQVYLFASIADGVPFGARGVQTPVEAQAKRVPCGERQLWLLPRLPDTPLGPPAAQTLQQLQLCRDAQLMQAASSICTVHL